MKKISLLLFVVFFISCINKENKVLPDQNLDDEYAVINQLLPQLGERSPLCFYYVRPNFSDSIEREIFYSKFNHKERKLIYSDLFKRGLDSSKIALGSIDIQVMNSTLESFDTLESISIDLNRINRPKGVILITENDSLYNDEKMKFERFSLSRVLLNKTKDTAYFEYGHSRGGLSGHGFKVTTILKNGSWIILNKKRTWIS